MTKPLEDVLTFDKSFTRQEPISESGIQKAAEVLQSGRLHRYNTLGDEIAEASLLEQEYAAYVGSRYCLGLASCGSSIYVALKSVGVQPGDKILSNAFTLAPVPGAIKNAEAEPVFVEIDEDYLTDLNDLEKKAKASGAKYFLLSHMRGHIVDMEQTTEICNRLGITMIEDCAHTMGATWGDQYTGTFGKVGCFSTQTYKHINSGEGGLLVTDDKDVAAKAILYSGSYMLYDKHLSRPPLEVFEKHKTIIPNFSLRMSNLVATLIRDQLPHLEEQSKRWNERYRLIEAQLQDTPHIRIPRRREKEGYVGSSFQFTVTNTDSTTIEQFVNTCADRGVAIKWFGRMEPKGFTSRHESWAYFQNNEALPETETIMDGLCDFRIPLTFTFDDCKTIVAIIRQVVSKVIEGDQ